MALIGLGLGATATGKAADPFQSAPGPAAVVKPVPARRPAVAPAEPQLRLPAAAPAAPVAPPKPLEITLPFSVNSNQMPWLWVEGGLNAGFKFSPHDGASPAAIDAAHFRFQPGDPLIVQYVSGQIKGSAVHPEFDANGNPNDRGVNPFGLLATHYIRSPTFSGELIGTFADAEGAIVGQPFAVGNGPTKLTVPAGATQLLLGFNWTLYSFTSGTMSLKVTGLHPAEPVAMRQ